MLTRRMINKKIILISCSSRDFILFRLGFMKKLKEKGANVIAVAPYDKYAKMLIENGFDFINLKINRKGLNPFEDFLLFINIIKIILKEKPDIIINYTIKPVIYCSIAAGFFDIKIIDVITGLGYVFIKHNLLTSFVKVLYRFALKNASKVIFQNREDLEYFIKKNITQKEKSLVILSSGVDTKYFSPFKKRVNKYVRFLYIGRILWDKGIREFVEAAKIVKTKFDNVEFDILGWFDKDNPSSVPFEYIKDLENKRIIKYLGDVEDVRPFIARSDVVVLPSYREGLPRSLLEAASMEKPIITTNAIGCKEVVDDRINGLLVPVKDIKALSEAMIWMIEHPKQRIQMGKKGRVKMIKEFDEKIVIKKYMKVIDELLKE